MVGCSLWSCTRVTLPTLFLFTTYVHLQARLHSHVMLCNCKVIATFDLVPNKCTNTYLDVLSIFICAVTCAWSLLYSHCAKCVYIIVAVGGTWWGRKTLKGQWVFIGSNCCSSVDLWCLQWTDEIGIIILWHTHSGSCHAAYVSHCILSFMHMWCILWATVRVVICCEAFYTPTMYNTTVMLLFSRSLSGWIAITMAGLVEFTGQRNFVSVAYSYLLQLCCGLQSVCWLNVWDDSWWWVNGHKIRIHIRRL